jgi:hypothetical protein
VVEWSDIVFNGGPPEPAEYPVSGQTGPHVPQCPASLRIATAGGFSYAVWWVARQDSSAILMASRSPRGMTWSPPVIADSTDHGVRGCGRPAPSIAVDSASGYVHLAYFAEPQNGSGIFFAHSMDSAATFHSPVPIVFGKNPSRTSIASSGDRVVVAYEDPNALRPRVGLGLSKTMGHIFEEKVVATPESGRALQPVVRIEGDSIRLWWSEYSPNPAVSATRTMYRAGHWK